nr:uncharacterized protein LOC112994718 [Dromaius novaehollandiae]
MTLSGLTRIFGFLSTNQGTFCPGRSSQWIFFPGLGISLLSSSQSVLCRMRACLSVLAFCSQDQSRSSMNSEVLSLSFHCPPGNVFLRSAHAAVLPCRQRSDDILIFRCNRKMEEMSFTDFRPHHLGESAESSWVTDSSTLQNDCSEIALLSGGSGELRAPVRGAAPMPRGTLCCAAAPRSGGSGTGRAEPEQPVFQGTLEDVAVCFSAEEWGRLAEWQKQLGRDMMLENYEPIAPRADSSKRQICCPAAAVPKRKGGTYERPRRRGGERRHREAAGLQGAGGGKPRRDPCSAPGRVRRGCAVALPGCRPSARAALPGAVSRGGRASRPVLSLQQAPGLCGQL